MENGRLRVETLGPLRAFVGDRELVLGPPKQRAVFAVLALCRNNIVSRDDLIDYVWGEAPPATATGNLHTYMSGLRRAFDQVGEALDSSGSGYSLRLGADGLDVVVAERVAARARASRADEDRVAAVEAFDEALACWRPGSALGGLPGPFAAEHRARVADLRLRLLMERAEVLLELGRPTAVAEQLQDHVRANPYHERLRGLLMSALHRSGQTADALAHYRELRKLLADDLGIDPSVESQALHASMLADSTAPVLASTLASALAPDPLLAPDPNPNPNPNPNPDPAPTPDPAPAPSAQPESLVRPAQLPRGDANFVGRVEAIHQVMEAARNAGGPQIALIVGAGGIGKTALAIRCAHLLAAAYPDGQLHVNLRGFDPRQPARTSADALHHLLASVNVKKIPDGRDQRAGLWRSIVRDKRMLIVLDNAESAEQVEDLLPGGGPSFVIVTSRNRLSGLSVRYAARRVAPGPLSADESLTLLFTAIGNGRVDGELAAARHLAELCDHLPLALRIAAEQVSAGAEVKIGDVAHDLENVRGRLDALRLPDDELSSVRGVLSWSYTRLDTKTARAFRLLGLVPGVGIRPEAAAALLALAPAQAADTLRDLAGQHLLETTAGSYWMHDLTRFYAEETSRLGEPDDSRQQALERLLEWYVRTLAQRYRATPSIRLPFTLQDDFPYELVSLGGQSERVAWCAQEWDNIAPLMRAAQRIGRHDRVWQLCYLLFEYFYAAGQARDWVETVRLGMRAAEQLRDHVAQAVLHNHLSVAYSRLGENDAAVRELHSALRLVEDLGEEALRISILGNLASTLREAKDYAAALPHAEKAVVLARDSGLIYYEAGTLDVLCELYVELGEFGEALRVGELGQQAARSCHNAMLEANILIALGTAEHGLGHADTAVEHFQEALRLSDSSDDYHAARALFGLAKVQHAQGRQGPAGGLAARALVLLRDLDAEDVDEVAEFLRGLDGLDRP
ncbi:tetratricopeptide repeat protein [Catenulispora sp. NL8]|uniref:Tetratricopeptide repeat protein n=1 Tax=Catenulispora pinistramenti TaxID=2705254 RepID=A0ABS5KQ15_9ACTN|nr:BTAD domain-containing putative transcriptional regulator [Catenulispora pinistramenti]MBS2548132.1 tetratricopeptide repeat protein [Catenulispora pinistramenti]